MENQKFIDFKSEIVKRAKEASACQSEYQRAFKSETFAELFKVITDNFNYCCDNKVIDCPLLAELGQELCNEHLIYVNISTNIGYLITDSATVRASDSATVEAWGSATVRASDSATVRASDSATVRASDSATVEAWGSATVRASDSATVRAWNSATVRASDSAYINSYNTIEHKISDKVILRYTNQNRIVLAENIAVFEQKNQ